MADKISIIVPIYKVEKFLCQCLDSIVGQTYRNLEIILVDDGSPDSCGAICDKYAGMDNRVIVVHQENQGVSVARNAGIERASGEWVMFVDPDDWLELDCCEKVLEIAQAGSWDVVYFQRQENDEAGNTSRVFPPVGSCQVSGERLRQAYLDILPEWKVDLLGFDSLSPWGKFYRRSFLAVHGLRFAKGIRKGQDVIFNLYCSEYIEQTYYSDYVGYHYRKNSSSINHRRNMKMLEVQLEWLREVERFTLQYHQNDPRYEKLVGYQVYMIPSSLKETMLFHPRGRMRYSEYRVVMDRYYDNETVSRYIDKCGMSDFGSVKRKVNYLLLSGHHVFFYYVISTLNWYIKQSCRTSL